MTATKAAARTPAHLRLGNLLTSFFYSFIALAAKEPAFATLAKELQANESTIVQELIDCQGPPVELGGYWMPDPELCAKAMRPSPTLEKVLSI
eukprot:6202162-Pleurochrysis_carterae.AAC.3